MIVKAPPTLFSVEQYFALDAVESDRKYDYIDGEIREVAGGTDAHSVIKLNISTELGLQLRGARCRLRNSDMRIKISDTRYIFPDLSAVCGEPLLEDNRTSLLNPIMTVEVTSPASYFTDRAEKLSFYSSIPSMRLYLIVDQDQVDVELHSKTDEGWLRQIYSDLDDVIRLEPLDCSLPLAEVYRDIDMSRS